MMPTYMDSKLSNYHGVQAFGRVTLSPLPQKEELNHKYEQPTRLEMQVEDEKEYCVGRPSHTLRQPSDPELHRHEIL